MRQNSVVWSMAVVIVLLCAATASHAQRPSLLPYTSLTRQYDTDKWLLEAMRMMDSEGIMMQNRVYHPLGIAFLGIMRYEDFLCTGDSAFYRQVLNQYKYFCDTTRVDIVDAGRGIALPYHAKHLDLQPPWYSGMAQGAGLSFLARYYLLTGDTTALRRMQQVAYVLLKPAAQGGTIGQTPEGYAWIEEYPNSKLAPEVLNGFIAGLIGLHEYCTFFPEDTTARRVEKACYQALQATISIYDTPEWTDYKRLRLSVLQLAYMRYQLAELEHLYEIYGDDFLIRQAMIWSMMTYNRIDDSQKSYRHPQYQFAKAILDTPSGRWIAGDSDFVAAMRPLSGRAQVGAPRTTPFHSLPLSMLKRGNVTLELGPQTYCLRLMYSHQLTKGSLGFRAYDRVGDTLPLTLNWQGKELWIKSQRPIARLAMTSLGKAPKAAQLLQVMVPAPESQALPRYGFYKLNYKMALEARKRYKIVLDLENIVGARLFFRHEISEFRFPLATWHKDSVVDLPATHFEPRVDGLYTFFIAFPLALPSPRIWKFELVPEE